ncbi:MAG TPA: RIP metalloprotease RseP [Syntrophales bacterium]|nr:RIP metalloprotease RseP [Syntrophales bacterium]HPO35402.1 RIP metalloprotease RseP [Syntrophales bacterium]
MAIIILLGVLIFVHEIGHFLAAKFFRVGILKFSLGFGRRLIGKKIGETEYVISLIPLGGYVKLLGESEEEVLSEGDRARSFLAQPVWKRAIIVFAGPFFNFLLAVMIFAFAYTGGVPVMTSEIGLISPEGAAYEAGMKAGDVIVKIDDYPIRRWDQIAERVVKSKGRPLRVTVKRGEESQEFVLIPRLTKDRNIFGEEVETYKIGVGPARKFYLERLNPLEAFARSLTQTWFITKMTFVSIVKILEGVLSPRSLGGPILIAQMAGEQVKSGVLAFVLFMAVLSINLGVLNLLPIPVLDGGHLLFYLIEAVRRKEVSVKWRQRAQQIGFILLVILMIYVMIMDIERLNNETVNKITGFFTK